MRYWLFGSEPSHSPIIRPVVVSHQRYDVRIPGLTGAQQDEIVRRLRAAGVAARHGFKPMHTQQEYQFKARRVHGQWLDGGAEGVTRAEVASREAIYFPLDPHLLTSNDDLAKTCFSTCRAVLEGFEGGAPRTGAADPAYTPVEAPRTA